MDVHKNLEDRIKAASEIQKLKPDIPMFIDSFDNRLNKAFGAYPERLYIIQDNIVMYQGKMGSFRYRLNEVDEIYLRE